MGHEPYLYSPPHPPRASQPRRRPPRALLAPPLPAPPLRLRRLLLCTSTGSSSISSFASKPYPNPLQSRSRRLPCSGEPPSASCPASVVRCVLPNLCPHISSNPLFHLSPNPLQFLFAPYPPLVFSMAGEVKGTMAPWMRRRSSMWRSTRDVPAAPREVCWQCVCVNALGKKLLWKDARDATALIPIKERLPCCNTWTQDIDSNKEDVLAATMHRRHAARVGASS